MSHWIINNQIISVEKDNGSIVIPSAKEIYVALNSPDSMDANGVCSDCPNICSELPEVRFSQYGAALELEVTFDDYGVISLVIWASKGKRRFRLNPNIYPIPDHVVEQNEWSFFTENYDETIRALDAADISKAGVITLSQYCSLLRSADTSPQIRINRNVLESVKALPLSFADPVPRSLRADLYQYQMVGYRWLSYMSKEARGCILGDEMGLGKTLQVITFLLRRKEDNCGPSLVISPVSLLENWKREIEKFAPVLSVLVHHGQNRTGNYKDLEGFDVIIISYGSSVSDLSMLKMVRWDALVLDEAQNIKNPDALRSLAVKTIGHRFGIAVSGTPFENHILDVWSIMDFVQPGYLGNQMQFERQYIDDISGAVALEPMVTPFMLRRKVDEVAKELPDKVEIPVPLKMSVKEADSYNQILRAILEANDPRTATLAALQRLRMFCTHPYIVDTSHFAKMSRRDPSFSSAEESSVKYRRLCEILSEIVENNEKALIFTSYTSMFDILGIDIPRRFKIPVFIINGQTPPDKRQNIVDEFDSISGSALMALNPQAAGTGLNITAANHVVHYNLEWNPAKEDQASARAYRRGQTKTVFVYRLYYIDTVEEVILDRIEKKRSMSDSAIIGTQGQIDDRKDIIAALTKEPSGDQDE